MLEKPSRQEPAVRNAGCWTLSVCAGVCSASRGGPATAAVDGSADTDVTNEPLDWCDGHHIVAWADGGTTDLTNACLVCAFHHRLLHHSDWRVRLASDGRPEFIPPATVDPQRRPRRNLYHCRQ